MATASTTPSTRRRKAPAGASQHPLEHLIPGKEVADEYVNRLIYGVHDFDFVDYAKEAHKNLLFAGDTGAGKTMLVEAYGAAKGIPVVTINANGGIDPNTFFGMPRMDETTGKIVWQWSEIALVIVNGGLLFIDECNFMQPRVSAVFHSLLDRRRMVTVIERGNEVLQAHQDLMVFAAYNEAYEGTRPLNAAFKNRFVPVEFDYDPKVEAQLLCMPVTAEIAKSLRDSRKNNVIDTPISTNMLVTFEEMVADISVEAAIECFITRFHEEERAAVREVIVLKTADITDQAKEMVDD